MKPTILIAMTRGADRLAGELLDRADLGVINFHASVTPYLEARGITCRQFTDFMDNRHKVQAAAEAEMRMDAVLEVVRGDEFRAAWPEYADDPDTWSALTDRIAAAGETGLLAEIALIDTLRRLANETDLRLIIVQQDISRETRTVIEAGHQLGIPTLHTLHGAPYGTVNALNLADSSYADVVAVFSEHIRDLFVSLGVPSDRVVVTGNFEWDIYTRPSRPGYRDEMCGHFGINAEQPVITYALTYPCGFSNANVTCRDFATRTTAVVIEAFVRLSKKHPDWQFILRPHPNDDTSHADLETRARQAGLERVWMDHVSSAMCCVAVSDVIVCCQSNLGIEAIIAGKPVINVVIDEFAQAAFDEGMGRLFCEDDAVLEARTPADIAPAIESALLDPDTKEAFLAKRPKTIRRFNFSDDGKATDRLCALVLTLLEKSADFVAPVERWPDYEALLARAIPSGADRVLVVGRAASYVADQVRYLSPNVEVATAETLEQQRERTWPVIVIADPAPHDAEAVENLSAARAALDDDGTLVALFLHGGAAEAQDAFDNRVWAPPREGASGASPMGQYSWQGVEMVLSRAGLVPERAHPRTRLVAHDTQSGEDGGVLRDVAHIDGWVVEMRGRP